MIFNPMLILPEVHEALMKTGLLQTTRTVQGVQTIHPVDRHAEGSCAWLNRLTGQLV